VGTRDYVLFGLGLSLAIGKHVVGPAFGKRGGGMFFDEDVRDALRQTTLRDERRARDISDVLLTGAVSYPFFDSVVIAGWYRGSPHAARKLAWINAEAMAVPAGLQGVTNIIAGRERPFGRRCGNGKPADSRDCDSNDRYYSFFSGHTSQAFTAAGLVCIHHAYLPIYGGTFYDGGICGLGMLTAAATGALRIAGDQHYFTDVATGAVVGTLVGVGLPWLLFYRHGPDAGEARGRDEQLRLQLLPTTNGLTLMGAW
jgi:membrane-associated phospholipid phosphatase